MIELLTVTSDRTACGICEYGRYLGDYLPGDITMRVIPGALDPQVLFEQLPRLREYQGPQVVFLNYHAALHSRWTPELIGRLRFLDLPVLVTFHDTGVPNSAQCRGVYTAVTSDRLGTAIRGAFVVHEPCTDLPDAIYLRQGVPAWQRPYQCRVGIGVPDYDYNVAPEYWLGLNNRPILGTVGFPFPWKNYDLLARATALAGWSLLLLAPDQYHGGKPDQLQSDIAHWRSLNPWTAVVSDFLPAAQVVSYLGMCDATAFLYMCANTGTSGAIRQGIAARKPILATAGCRQFRDLEMADYGAISWLTDLSPAEVANALMRVPITRMDPRVHRLAERDSWRGQGERYGAIIRGLVG